MVVDKIFKGRRTSVTSSLWLSTYCWRILPGARMSLNAGISTLPQDIKTSEWQDVATNHRATVAWYASSSVPATTICDPGSHANDSIGVFFSAHALDQHDLEVVTKLDNHTNSHLHTRPLRQPPSPRIPQSYSSIPSSSS